MCWSWHMGDENKKYFPFFTEHPLLSLALLSDSPIWIVASPCTPYFLWSPPQKREMNRARCVNWKYSEGLWIFTGLLYQEKTRGSWLTVVVGFGSIPWWWWSQWGLQRPDRTSLKTNQWTKLPFMPPPPAPSMETFPPRCWNQSEGQICKDNREGEVPRRRGLGSARLWATYWFPHQQNEAGICATERSSRERKWKARPYSSVAEGSYSIGGQGDVVWTRACPDCSVWRPLGISQWLLLFDHL